MHLTTNVVKYTIAGMLTEAQRSNNEDLKAAAAILNQFVFGNSQFSAPSLLSKQQGQNREQEQLNAEKQNWITERFETIQGDLTTRADNVIRSTVANNIDTKDLMSPYVKEKAIDDCMALLEDAINGDARFKTTLDRLWQDVINSDFSRASQDKVLSTYKSKARTLLPQIILKARTKALQGLGRGSSSPKSERFKANTAASERGQDNKKSDSKKPDTKGLSTFDILNS